MPQEIDLESTLRVHVRTATPVEVTVRINNEGRIVAKIGDYDGAPEYIVFGNNVCQHPPPKPPTQYATAQGFDSHRGMGQPV